MNLNPIYPYLFLAVFTPLTFADNNLSQPAEIIVTATRTAVTADEALASVSVITRDDIKRQQAQSLKDLLQGLAGINITSNGGQGKASSIFFRGSESGHVLVLIDGIKFGSATLGIASLEYIPVEQIERIEIVRGPLSSLYGSEAIGGVIQIFTRKGDKETKPFFSFGTGKYNTYTASAGVSGATEALNYSFSVNSINTDGFNACKGNDFAGCYTIEPDKDADKNLAGNLRLGYQFDNGLELDLHALQSNSTSDFDGSFVNQSDSVQTIYGASLNYDVMDIWQLSVMLGNSKDSADNFKDGIFQTRFNTTRHDLTLKNDLMITNDQLFTLGVDYQKDKVGGTTAYTKLSRDNTGTFIQYLGTIAHHELQLSLRHDDNEQFGNQNTGNIAWGYKLGNKIRLNASYGTAYRAPSFNDLYFPGYGNSNIKPEKSKSIEVGISQKRNWGGWSTHLFETSIDDLIAYDASINAAGNVDKAIIRGIEMMINAQLGLWSFNGNYTINQPENRTNGIYSGNMLARRSKQMLRIDADYTLGKYRMGATLLAQGKRYEDLANSYKLAAYTSIDIRAEYAFAKNWLIQAKLENLLDKEYETAAYYNQPGRGFYITLRYQP